MLYLCDTQHHKISRGFCPDETRRYKPKLSLRSLVNGLMRGLVREELRDDLDAEEAFLMRTHLSSLCSCLTLSVCIGGDAYRRVRRVRRGSVQAHGGLQAVLVLSLCVLLPSSAYGVCGCCALTG
jgi:hypothetical protein